MEEMLFLTQGSRGLQSESNIEQASSEVKDEAGMEQKSQQNADKPKAWTPAVVQRMIRWMPARAPMRTIPVSTLTGVEDRMVYVPFTAINLIDWQEITQRRSIMPQSCGSNCSAVGRSSEDRDGIPTSNPGPTRSKCSDDTKGS